MRIKTLSALAVIASASLVSLPAAALSPQQCADAFHQSKASPTCHIGNVRVAGNNECTINIPCNGRPGEVVQNNKSFPYTEMKNLYNDVGHLKILTTEERENGRKENRREEPYRKK